MQIFKLQIYNDKLDPLLWDNNGNLNPKVSNLLLRIAHDFYNNQKLKAPILDVVLLGSSAGYNYTQTSDIDVHVIIDFDDLNMEREEAKKYMNCLKSNWNKKHNINIRNKNIEMYIQDVDDLLETRAAGIYSLLNSRWLKRPIKENVIIDKELIKKTYIDCANKINQILINPTKDSVEKILGDVYKLREKGLQETGEYSTENIVFKLLRSNKFIERLREVELSMYDKQMSISEGVVDDVAIKKEIENGGKIIRFVADRNGEKIGKISLNRDYLTGYFTITAFNIYQKLNRGVGIGKKLITAVLNDHDILKKPILVQPYPYYGDETKIEDLVSMYKHFGFRDWEKDKHYLIYDKKDVVSESIKYDQKDGIGAVPWNQEVDYRGFKKAMTPDEFLGLALPMYDKGSIQKYIDLINTHGLASPWLEVEWKGSYWRVVGHEGRHRMAAIKKMNPNEQVEVHIFPRGMRARDITNEMKEAVMLPQTK